MLENLTKNQALLVGMGVATVGLVAVARSSDTARDKIVDYMTKDGYTGYSDGSNTFTSIPVEVTPA